MDKYITEANKIIKEKDEYIHRIGKNTNGIYYIKKGRIRCNFIGKEGNIKTFSLIGEGCLFGEQFILHHHPGLFETVVVNDAELYFFDRENIINIMKDDFEVSMLVLTSLAIKARMLAAQLEDKCMLNTLQNISKLLYSIWCHEKRKTINNKPVDIAIQLSHQDLADITGSHRVTVSRSLAYLKKQGVLDYGYENIIIKKESKHKLREIAYDISK